VELPRALREAVDNALAGVSTSDLTRAAEILSQRYRAETRDGRLHLADDLAARAYLATRLPATYAAIRSAMAAVADVRPDFAPRTLLDVGAGPGSALWAATECWGGIDDAVLLEASPAVRAWGERLCALAPVGGISWQGADIVAALPELAPRDLVTLAYVLDELDPAAREDAVRRLWALVADTLLIVEPGTPAGWARILAARERLTAWGAHIVAPCPHAAACPLSPPDWCHFSRRVARSRLHRRVKDAELSWEDEKYIYLAAARRPAATAQARVIAKPRAGGGRVGLKLCRPDGSVGEQLLTRRDGTAFKAARGLNWGDVLP
jgi:ribosomal protein RSM22 (predicted rRNA methylase)